MGTDCPLQITAVSGGHPFWVEWAPVPAATSAAELLLPLLLLLLLPPACLPACGLPVCHPSCPCALKTMSSVTSFCALARLSIVWRTLYKRLTSRLVKVSGAPLFPLGPLLLTMDRMVSELRPVRQF